MQLLQQSLHQPLKPHRSSSLAHWRETLQVPTLSVCLCTEQQVDPSHANPRSAGQGDLPLLHLPNAVLSPLDPREAHAQVRRQQLLPKPSGRCDSSRTSPPNPISSRRRNLPTGAVSNTNASSPATNKCSVPKQPDSSELAARPECQQQHSISSIQRGHDRGRRGHGRDRSQRTAADDRQGMIAELGAAFLILPQFPVRTSTTQPSSRRQLATIMSFNLPSHPTHQHLSKNR